MSTDHWLLGIAVLVTVGFALLIRTGLDDVLTLSTALFKRTRRIRLTRSMTADAPTFTTSSLHRSPILIGFGAGLLLAIAWLSDPVLAIWFVVWGAGAGWIVQRSRPVIKEDLRALEVFVSTLRSVFAVGQSIINALELAAEQLDAGPLQATVLDAVHRYRADLNTTEALAVLKSLRWTHLSRLALVLDQIGHADEAAIRSALLDLEGRVRTARRLRDRANTVLTLSRLTLRVLQAANLTALIAVTLLPAWHTFYGTNPFGLIAATGMALAGQRVFRDRDEPDGTGRTMKNVQCSMTNGQCPPCEICGRTNH